MLEHVSIIKGILYSSNLYLGICSNVMFVKLHLFIVDNIII